jgi:hypothetical protein
MEESVSTLSRDVKAIEDALHININSVHEQLQNSKNEMYDRHSEMQQIWHGVTKHLSGTWAWFKYITSVVGVSFVLYALSTVFRKKEQVKKFI